MLLSLALSTFTCVVSLFRALFSIKFYFVLNSVFDFSHIMRPIHFLLMAFMVCGVSSQSTPCDGGTIQTPPCYCDTNDVMCEGSLEEISAALVNLPETRLKVHVQYSYIERVPSYVLNVFTQRLRFAGNGIKVAAADSFPKDIETLGLDENNITVFPTEALKKLNKLKVLDLSFNHLLQLPADSISGLSSLLTLNLTDNDLAKIDADAFRSFQGHLRSLDLSRNRLYILGDALQYLPSLTSLNVGHNHFRNLGREIGFHHLPNLQHLTVSDNAVDVIEKDTFITVGKTLQTLNLANNAFTSVPFASLRFLQNLESLNLERNFIQHVNNTFPFRFEHLQALNLHGNNIQVIQPSFFFWVSNSLDELNLSNNKISEITDETFGYLPQLGELDLSHNEIKEAQVGHYSFMQRMRSLNLSFNKLKYIPEDVFLGLINVEFISLAHNEIWDIPTLVFRAVNPTIQHIQINSNFLSKIPQFAFSCLRLVRLEVHCNQIWQVDYSTFAHSKHLEYIDFSHNKLSDLPSRLFITTGKVQTLRLSYNSFEYVNANAFIGIDMAANASTDHFTLLLDHNKLKNVPTAAIGMIQTLTNLDLSYNAIENIYSTDFRDTPTIRVLNISNNLLRLVAGNSFSGMRLDILDLSDNPGLNLSLTPDVFEKARMKKFVLKNLGLTNLPAIELSAHEVEEFDLSENQLQSIPDTVLYSGLTSLNLADCLFSAVPSYLWSQVPNLRELTLSGNPITNIGTDSFQGVPNLEVLRLSNLTSLKGIDPDSFRPLQNLRVLDISGLPLTVQVSTSNLCQLKFLESLSISINREEILTPVCQTLSPRLTKLYYTGTTLGTVTKNALIPYWWTQTSHSEPAYYKGPLVKEFSLTGTRVKKYFDN